MSHAGVIIAQRESLDAAWIREHGHLPTDPGSEPRDPRDKRNWYIRSKLWTDYQAERRECAVSRNREAMYLAALLACGPQPRNPTHTVMGIISEHHAKRGYYERLRAWQRRLHKFHADWSKVDTVDDRKHGVFRDRYLAWLRMKAKVGVL